MNVAAAVILITLAVIGAAAVVRELSLRLFCGKDDCTVMYITHISDKCENAEFVLRSALAKRRWSGRNTVSTVCLDCSMDRKTRKICEGICREYGFDSLLTKEEFIKSLD